MKKKYLDQAAFDFVMDNHQQGITYRSSINALTEMGYTNKKGGKITIDALGTFMRKRGYVCKYRNFGHPKNQKEVGEFNLKNFDSPETNEEIDKYNILEIIIDSKMPKDKKLKVLAALL